MQRDASTPVFDAGAFQRFEEEGWNRKASAYHGFYLPISSYVIDDLLDAAGVRAGSRVLDVGSGPGYAAAMSARRGAEVIGIDLAESMVEMARRLHPEVRFAVGDAQDLAFLSRSFDAVLGNFAFHHLPDGGRAMTEFYRVLSAGGCVAMTAWDEPARCRFIGLFSDSIRRAGARQPDEVPVGPPMATTDEDYFGVLEAAGFDEARVETIEYAHTFADADELWDGLLSASVRTAALITEQPPQVQTEIRAIFDDLAAEYRTERGLEVPVSVKLFSGRRGGR